MQKLGIKKKYTFKWICLPWLLFKWIKFHLNSNKCKLRMHSVLTCKMQKNWESRDTASLVHWRPRLFQSSTVCKSLLVLNGKDDLRADGQRFCFLASSIQRETPFSFLCFGLLSFFWFFAPSSPLICRFYLQKIEQRPKGSPCFFLVSLLLFFHLFSLLLSTFPTSQ